MGAPRQNGPLRALRACPRAPHRGARGLTVEARRVALLAVRPGRRGGRKGAHKRKVVAVPSAYCRFSAMDSDE